MKAVVVVVVALIAVVAMVNAVDNDLIPTSTLTVPNDATSLSMVVEQGEVFNVLLNGNPTTGYQWMLENNDQLGVGAVRALNLNERNVGEYIKATNTNSGNSMVGVGGYYNFKFKAGNTSSNALITLNFVYKRLWESTPAKQVEVKVQIA